MQGRWMLLGWSRVCVAWNRTFHLGTAVEEEWGAGTGSMCGVPCGACWLPSEGRAPGGGCVPSGHRRLPSLTPRVQGFLLPGYLGQCCGVLSGLRCLRCPAPVGQEVAGTIGVHLFLQRPHNPPECLELAVLRTDAKMVHFLAQEGRMVQTKNQLIVRLCGRP